MTDIRGAWHRVAIVAPPTPTQNVDVEVFVDGMSELSSQASSIYSIYTSAPLAIGPLDGTIDQVEQFTAP